MSPRRYSAERRKLVREFVSGIFRAQDDAPGPLPPAARSTLRMTAATPPQNQPDFWADAPWRVEPDCDHFPMLFIIRDADIRAPAKGPWNIETILVRQRIAEDEWHQVCALTPAGLPDIDSTGKIPVGFWTFGIDVPLTESTSPVHLDLCRVERGGPPIHLCVAFVGSFPPHTRIESTEIHLEVFLASDFLPQGRAAPGSGPRHWFYGDTHYHSDYTNDVKEFGGPVLAARAAGHAIGLDWLVVTDHSCDLDEVDPGKAETRWERLKAELATPEASDEQFRCVLGEEITLRGGKGERLLHMLAFGGMDKMVVGGFLPEDDAGFMTEAFRVALQAILDVAARTGGYPVDLARRLFGPVQILDQVLESLPAGTLAFAAHPYDVSQPPFLNCTWDAQDRHRPRLTGQEWWNGRTRRSAHMTADPFSDPDWSNPGRLAKADTARVSKLRQHAEQDWEPSLQRVVDSWEPASDLPASRSVLIAGSDAHGSFNYTVGWGWDYQTQWIIDDNALGRVRTAIHLPDHTAETVPEIGDILAALRKGSCVATDGPLVELSLTQGARTAYMGDVLTVDNGGKLEMKVVVHSTPEFGCSREVEVLSYFQGQGGPARKTIVPMGESRTIELHGPQGYCRVQAESVNSGSERFCCFTNPVWVRITDGKKKSLRIAVVCV